MKKHIIVLSLLSLLAMPMASFAAPKFVPPGKLKVKVQNNINATTTPPNSTSKPPRTTSTPPKATSTPRVVKTNFNLTGEIVSVNASSSMLQVKIKTINHFSSRRDYRGKIVMIKVGAETVIRMSGGKNKNATLADLGSGQKVTIKGKVENEQFSASSIVAAGKPVPVKNFLKKIFKK